MERFHRIAVYLSDSPADEAALSFAGRFAELVDCGELHCTHIRGGKEDFSRPDPDPKEFEQVCRASLPATYHEKTIFKVDTRAGMSAVLHSARTIDPDLLVVGRRLPTDQLGVGSVYAKLARRAPCSLLVVPAFTRLHLSRMLVAMDCSEHSKLALRTALATARSNTTERPQVLVHSIYSVGYGYRYAGTDFHEAGARLENSLRTKLKKLIADVDTAGIDFETIFTCSEETAAAVHAMAAVRKMDVIVVGSRRASLPAARLLGGTAERILLSAQQPVLIVKRKGQSVPLLEALLAG